MVTLTASSTLAMAETVCTVLFSFELAVRMFASCDFAEFRSSFMNLIDLVTVIPYYVELAMTSVGRRSAASLPWH